MFVIFTNIRLLLLDFVARFFIFCTFIFALGMFGHFLFVSRAVGLA